MTMMDSLPPTVAGPANDDTAAMLASSPDVETVLAWSQDTDPDGGRESWGWAFSYAAAVIVMGVVIAVLIGVLGGMLLTASPPPAPPAAPHNTAPVLVPPPNPTPPPQSAPPVWKTVDPAPTVTRQPPIAPPPSMPPAPPMAPIDLDTRYLSDLIAGGLRITDVPTVLAGAHDVCDYLDTGHTEPDAVAAALHNNPTLTVRDAHTMVDSAINVYCPNYG